MKRWQLLLTIVVACLLVGASAYRGTNDRDYNVLRTLSATDDTGPAATDCNATAADALISASTAKMIYRGRTSQFDTHRGNVTITFAITNATGEVADWALYGIKMNSSPLEFIAYGNATAGVTETDATGGATFYADDITITQSSWNSSVSVIDGYQFNMGTGVVTDGGIAKLLIDSCEYKYLVMYMAKDTCASMGADFTTY